MNFHENHRWLVAFAVIAILPSICLASASAADGKPGYYAV